MKVLVLLAILLVVASVFAEAAPAPKAPKVPPPKKMRCTTKKSSCYGKVFECPASCSRNCTVNCNTCQPECGPKKPKQKEVKCKDKKLYPVCSTQKLLCPEACPQTCSVDCAQCKPVCGPVSPVYSPPPPVSPAPPPTPIHVDPYPPPPPTLTPPALPPPTSGVSPKHLKSRCQGKKYSYCYNQQFTCPATCPYTCEVDCVTCKPVCSCDQPGTVCQDPKFVGADGMTFYFHGKKEQDFCLVTDSNLHINAHFIGKRNAEMGRDFTWVQSLGIMFDNHKIYVGAQKTATWNDAVDRLSLIVDGKPIELPESKGANWASPDGTDVKITRSATTNSVVIEAEGKFKIKAVVVPITEKDSLIHKYGVTKENCLAHLDLSFKFYSLNGDVNGVLGQTYASNYVSRVKMGVAMSVLGGEKEFHSSSLFATDCAVSKFVGKGTESSSSVDEIEFAGLNCASGISGRGVVCKKR